MSTIKLQLPRSGLLEQSVADYDPQVGALLWLPLATNAILYPCGSSLTREVGILGINNLIFIDSTIESKQQYIKEPYIITKIRVDLIQSIF
ncbi:MAG: hypothetical protein PF692_09570 [Kiritimatiellae bacterium]|jgi:hypothetical protein|nr:hypothetical protein [Kiritimatiellia bacterium]